MKRSSGVLLHVSSLPGKYGCGDFGRGATDFIDKMAACGFSWWQVLPFCVPDRFASPYSSMSTFSGNPYFIDLEELQKRGLLTAEELASAEERSPYACEFDRLAAGRLPLLFRAAERALRDADTSAAVDTFMDTEPRIAEFCLFMARRAANGDRAGQEWTTDGYDPAVLAAWRFIQYEFFGEWAKVKAYANSKGIGVIGDIPFYVAPDSSDVWGSRGQFLLGSDGRPDLVAGVPPDYFSEDGQLWGNPLYDWKHMRADGYSFWRDRLSFMLSMLDGIRIDHFRAVESYFAIPGDAVTAREGGWRRGPGLGFAKIIKDIAGDKLVIAEDLGDDTAKARELIEKCGFSGIRVLQFGFTPGRDMHHRPHSYPEKCAAYTGTHDNNTLLGDIYEMPPDCRRELFDYCGCPDNFDAACVQAIRVLIASAAGTVIIPMQDILGFGADTRMNRPGVGEGNWTFRITYDQLSSVDVGRFARMNELTGRK